jgi:hypothetical protein
MMEFSERESKLFNLRFGRATIHSDLDTLDEVIKQSRANNLDYLRLKVTDPDSHFLSRLSSIGHRAYLTGIIRLYKGTVELSPSEVFNPDLLYKKVDFSQKEIFKDFISSVYADYPLGYFQYPELSERFPLDLQLQNISSYFADYFSGTYTDREAYMGYVHDEPVTCFVLDFNIAKVASCLYAGVVQPYRSKGVFRDIIRQMCQITHARGIRQLIAGARLENVSSQYGMSMEIGICYGHEWVYIIGFDK